MFFFSWVIFVFAPFYIDMAQNERNNLDGLLNPIQIKSINDNQRLVIGTLVHVYVNK